MGESWKIPGSFRFRDKKVTWLLKEIVPKLFSSRVISIIKVTIVLFKDALEKDVEKGSFGFSISK